MAERLELWFVVPDPDAFVSGGNRYNAALLGALPALGHGCTALTPAQARLRLEASAPDVCFVDTLHLDEVADLARCTAGRCRLGLLVHFLPSLVGWADTAERAALAAADWACATSAFMQCQLAERGFDRSRIFVVEPGQSAVLAPSPPSTHDTRALLVANLTPEKGVLELLEQLARLLTAGDRLTLIVVGDVDRAPEYAARCRRAAAHPALAGRVTFTGAVPHAALLRWLERANLLVSASKMESFGMALAEARVAGLPLLALQAGNAAQHVTSSAGGELAGSIEALAGACARLARAPEERAERVRLARNRAPEPRPWIVVAEELAATVRRLLQAEA